MTRFCGNCHIHVDGERTICPVCGRKLKGEDGAVVEAGKAAYPKYEKWQKKRKNIFSWVSACLLVFTLVFLITELSVTGTVAAGWYVLASSALLFLVVLWPLMIQSNFMVKSVVGILAISGFLLFLELYTHTFGWGLAIAIPMVLMGYDLLLWLFMMTRGYYQLRTLFPGLFIALTATVVALLNLTVFAASVVIWPSIVVLAVSWATLILLFLFRYRKIISGLKKDFHT